MDKVLKRRLIGASILIALAVIFVPMLLVDPESVGEGASGEVEVPEMPDSAREVRRIPLDPESARVADSGRRTAERDASPETEEQRPERPERESPRPVPDDEIVLRPDLAAPSESAESEPQPAAETGEPVPGTDAEGLETEPEPEPEPERERDDTRRAEPSLGDWIVQVASFGSRESAEQVRSRLEALGHAVQRDEIVRGQTMLHRLQTGPYSSRDAAEQALDQIVATVDGVEPIVREIDEQLRAGTEPGFVVQVGSFVGEENADGETQRLAGLGFDSFRFSEEVGDRMIWRVVVGPVPERSQADELESRLAEQAGVEGLVISYP